MSRPPRLEFPGALYHVTARGNRLATIYRDEIDRRAWIAILRNTCARFNLRVHAYCQMTNHFHLLIETPDGNLARGMAYLNGLYSRHVNYHHALVGHLFQGRYKAILVQKESYLLELARYVVLNPVRAGMVSVPEQWDWSSYRWTTSDAIPPPWLHTDFLLSQFGGERREAIKRFRVFVQAGMGKPSPLRQVKYQLILGDTAFVSEHRDKAPRAVLDQATKIQRRHTTMSLRQFAVRYARRDEAMARAFWSTAFTMAAIGDHFGVSPKTVSRAVLRFEATLRREAPPA